MGRDLRWLKNHFRNSNPQKGRRSKKSTTQPAHKPFQLEPIESRVLLNADGLIPGITGAVTTGLMNSGDTLLGVISNDPQFNTPIPGVLQFTHDVRGADTLNLTPNGKVNDKDLHVPIVTDVLSLNVNRDASADGDGFETISSLNPPIGTPISVNLADVVDIYRYVSGQKTTFIGPTEISYTPSIEQALAAMDLNSGSTADNIVDFREMYKVLVVGAIGDYLQDFPTGTGIDADTLKGLFDNFLAGLAEPSSISSLIDLDLTAVSNNTDSSHFAYSFTMNLKVRDQFLIDLGLNADTNEILFPEKVYTAGTPDDPNTAGNELVNPGLADVPPGSRTVELIGSIVMPFSFTVDHSPASGFRFAVPNVITVGVDDNVSGAGGETLNELITNIGFLGTQVPGPDSASKFNLHMGWEIRVTDPSSPAHLGFTTLPAGPSVGTLTANEDIPNDPGTPFVFPQDVFFDLTIGTNLNSPRTPVTVTSVSTTENDDAIDLRIDVQTALNAASLGGGLVTAGLNGSNQLTLSLPASLDITPLGYTGNELFDNGGSLLALSGPSILGSTSPIQIKFLLSVGGAIPKLVTVNTTPVGDNENGIDGDSDDNELSLDGLVADLNAAFGAAGLVGVSASHGLGLITISHGSLSLEVTRTLKLDAKFEITATELAHPSFLEFLVASKNTSNDVINILMPLEVRQGLDFDPTGNPAIKVDEQPFNFTNSSLSLDASNVYRLALPLKDEAGILIDADGSNFLQYLHFNAVGPGEAIGMIQQLETWLTKMRNTDMLGKFSIPFAQAVLGNLLAFDDMIHDTLLVEDGDSDEIADIGKLLAKITAIDPDAFVTTFGTAQELGARLDKLFHTSILVKPTVNTDGDAAGSDFAAYNKDTRELTYQLSLTHVLEADNVAADYTANVDMDPDVISDIATESKVHLQATGHFDAILGMELGPGRITETAPTLAELNGNLGADIEEGIAFTGAFDVLPVFGRLSDDAHFSIAINSDPLVNVTVYSSVGTQPFTPVVDTGTEIITITAHGLRTGDAVVYNDGGGTSIGNLTNGNTYYVIRKGVNTIQLADTVANALAATPVPRDLTSAGSGANHTLLHPNNTATNSTTAHLLADINSALATAGIGSKIQAVELLGRVLLQAIDASVLRFAVTASPTDTAYSEIGLASTVATTIILRVEPSSVKVSADVTLNFEINNSNVTDASITLNSESTGATATGGNNTLTDLVNDINEGLAGTSLNGKVVAARSGNTLMLVGIDTSIKSLRVSSSAGPAGEIGFGSPVVGGVFLVAPNDLGTPLTTPTDPRNFFGQLTADAHFSIKINGGAFKDITITVADTFNAASPSTNNASLEDLVADINTKINADADLASKVQAFEAGNLRIGFRAIHEEVLSFQVRTPNSADPSVTQMGLFDGTQTADASLRVTAIKNAPFFFGPTSDATFFVSVAGGTSDTLGLFKTVTVRTSETLTNQTIQDLAGDVRRALDAAFGSVANNPLLVSNDGDRILLKPKSTGSGVGVTAFTIKAAHNNTAITDLKMYRAGTAVVPGDVVSDADTADLLIYTKNGVVHRITLDFDADIGDVLASIDPDGLGAGPIDAKINSTASGLTLIDRTTAIPTPPLFRVDSVNGSHAAQALGIFGADTDASHPSIDSQIDGTRIGVLQLANRFFLRQVSPTTPILSADIVAGAATFNAAGFNVVDLGANTIKIFENNFKTGDPVVYRNGGGTSIGNLSDGTTYFVIVVDPDDPNTIKLAGSKEDALANSAIDLNGAGTGTQRLESLLSLEANFGFVGIELEGSGTLSGTFKMGLQNTSSTAKVQLAQLLDAMSKDQDNDGDVDVFDLATLVSYPTVTTSSPDFGTLSFVTTLQGGLPADTIDLNAGALIKFKLDNFGNPFTSPKDVTFSSADVDIDTDTITKNAHGLAHGMEVIYRNGDGGTDIGGLLDGGRYFVISVDANHFKLATSRANATASTPVAINLTSVGGGTDHGLQGFVPTLAHAQVDFSDANLADLVNFTEIEFTDLIGALEGLSDFLNEFASLPFLNEEIPLLGVSFNELVDIAARFETAVTEIVQNPAATVQKVEQKIRETFGLSPTSNVFSLSLLDNGDGDGNTTDLLKVKLNLSKEFSKALSVDLDLGDELPGISIIGSAGLSIAGSLSALLTFGVDLDDPLDIYLFTHNTQTGISAELDAKADNLTFNAALGPLGIFITGGDVDFELNGGFEKAGGSATDKILLSALLADPLGAGFTPSFDGSLEATLPVFFPTESTFKGDIKFEATLVLGPAPNYELDLQTDLDVPPDILNVDFSQFSLFDTVILAVDTFDAFLAGVQDILDGEIFGVELPLIGDKLSEGAEFISDIRKNVVQPFKELVQTAQESGPEIVQTFLFDLLGPGNGGSISGLGLLLDPTDLDPAGNPTAATESDRSHIDDIVSILENLTGPIAQNFVQWNFLLGQVYTPPLDFDFDLGFPGLSLDLEGNLIFSLGWTLALGLGVSIEDGPYIEILRTNSDDPMAHAFPNTPNSGPQDTFEDISPDSSDDPDPTPLAGAGGRFGGLASVAGDNQTFYAASEYGGIYKTTDGGQTWVYLDNHLPQVTWDVEVDPSAVNRVYATSFYDGRVQSISGINVSNDSGNTWTHPASSVPDNSGGGSDNTPQEGYMVPQVRIDEPSAFGISIDATAPANVAIGTNAGVAISHDSGATWQFFNPYRASVFFDTALFNLESPTDTDILDTFIPIIQKYLTDNPTLNVQVAGYTDTVGTPLSNQALSEDRADAVRDYLVTNGVDTNRITIIGFGEDTAHLAVATADEVAEAANRRVEIHLQAGDVYDVVYHGGIIDIAGALGHARSTDGGVTWQLPHQPFPNRGGVSIAASPDEPNVIFLVSNTNRLYESSDAGVNWTLIGSDTNPQGRTSFVTVNDRTGAAFDIWFGDTDLFRIPATSGVVGLRAFPTGLPTFATDGVDNNGNTAVDEESEWYIQNAGNVNAPILSDAGAHDDAGDVVFDTESADGVPLIHTTDGGVYRSTSGAQLPGWQQPTKSPHAQWMVGFASVDQPGNEDEDLYLGLQDNGLWALQQAGAANASTLWHNRVGADVFDVAAENDQVMWNLGVFRNDARTIKYFLGSRGVLGHGTGGAFGESGGNNSYPASGDVISFKLADSFDTWGDDKFAVLTGDDTTFLDGGLFITTNIKAVPINWTELTEPAGVDSSRFADLQAAVDGSGIPTFYVTVGVGNGFTGDELWKVTGIAADGSGAAVWTRIDTNIAGVDGTGGSGVLLFTVNEKNANRLYASVMTLTGPEIWRSNDGGSNWTQDEDLEDMMRGPANEFQYQNQTGAGNFAFNITLSPFDAISRGFRGYTQPTLLAFDPENPDMLVAGAADAGVFFSNDDGASWRLLTDPVGTDPNVPHLPRPRFVHFDHEGGATTLYVASQGRGVWRIKVDVVTQDPNTINPDATEATNDNLGGADDLAPVPAFDNDLGVDNRSINEDGDVDFFKFTATHTGNAIVSLYFDQLFGDLNLTIQNSGGSDIDTGDQSNLKDHLDVERVIFPVVEGTTYYIKVNGAPGATGYYDVVYQESVPELNLFIEAGIGTGSTLTGKLAFLQLDVTAVDTSFDGDGDTDPTRIRADFTVDIFNKDNPGDTRLSLFELGSVDAAIGITADAEVNLDLKLGLNEDMLPDTISAAIPTVGAQFHLDWSVGGPISGDLNLADGLRLLEFTDVSLDLGSFLSETVGPVVAKIQEITGPLQPIIDIVTARIPVLSDLAGRTITLVDIAAAFGEFDASLIYAVADIISLVNMIDTGGGESLVLVLGDFKLVDAAHPEESLLGGAEGVGSTGAGLLTNPNFSFGNDSLGSLPGPIADFAQKLGSMPGLGALGDLTDPAKLDSFLGGASSSPTATTTKSLFSGGFSSTPDDSGFAFPIFEDPSQVFGLLLGRNATLITYDLPRFMLDFKWEVSFPIYPPLYGVVTAGIGLNIDLAFGYDTQGIMDFAEGDFQNPLDLLSGFFISDTDIPDGSFGVDVPELVFKGTIGVGAELNAGIASAGVNANIILTVNFDLYDPNHDGKVRISELVSTFLFEARNGNPALAPIAIFDVFGDVSFQLTAFIKFLFAKFEFDITPPIVLFEFSIPFDREPILATERGDGTVLLNIGPNAAARQNGDVRDIAEKIFIGDGGAGKVAIWAPDFGVPQGAAQLYSIGAGKAVVGFGGEGDDIIDASALTTNPVIFEGGSGRDTLKGGSGKDSVKGDVGDDDLYGNSGDDSIYGGEGNDTIDGGPNADIIFGDSGTVNTSGAIRTSNTPKDGDDIITGGTGADIIFGNGGNDEIGGDVAAGSLDGGGATDHDFIFGDGASIEATGGGLPDLTKTTNPDGTVSYLKISLTDHKGGGNDTVHGHAGNDVIFGGSGDDDLDGGTENDIMFGESGFDLISGGGHADLIMGGTEHDRIFGFRDEGYPGDITDGEDTIFGETGNDFIRGNWEDDIIHGNAGADVIFGDFGNDTITGDTEPDLIFGGPDRDTIDAGTGNDIVFGDDGFVVWVNFFDPDIFDATDTPDDHRAIGFIGGDADVFDNVWNPAITDAALDALDADIRADADKNEKSLDLIKTLVNGLTDGNDTITGGDGDDIVLGGADALFNGVKGDTIFGDFNPGVAPGTPPAGPIPVGQDILIGDGGRLQFDDRRRDNIRTIPGTSAAEVGDDSISGNASDDLIFGGGANDTLYGRMNAAFTNPLLNEDSSLTDNDVIIGDDGEIQYETLGETDSLGPGPVDPDGEGEDLGPPIVSLAGIRAVFVFIRTEELDANALAFGGVDHAYGNKGEDIIFGGVAGDFLKGDDGADGADIILGDNGQIDFGLDNDGVSTKIEEIYTTDTLETTGGADTIEGQDDNDIIFGGVNNGGIDFLYGDRATPVDASDAQDIILGDNGKIRFNVDADLDTIDFITSYEDGLGGTDNISGSRGTDLEIGGTGGDVIYGDNAAANAGANDLADILLGDNADITLVAKGAAVGGDLKVIFGSAVKTIRTTDEDDDNPIDSGGSDTISGNAGGDIIAGGVEGDTLYGDALSVVPSLDGDDIILGDNGAFEWLSTGRLGEIHGIDIQANNLPLYNKFNPGVADTDLTTLDLITTEQKNNGGRDKIYGDENNDLAFGGTDLDWIHGDDGNEADEGTVTANRDVLFGDHGRLYPHFSSLLGFNSRNFFAIDTASGDGGEGDLMWGEEGDDVMLGQQGDDRMWGGSGNDDMLGGHNVSGSLAFPAYDEFNSPVVSATLDAAPQVNDLMDGGSGNDAMTGDNAIVWRRGDDLSPRFQALTNTGLAGPADDRIYTTTPSTITTNVPWTLQNQTMQSDPADAVGRDIEFLDHSDGVQADPQGRFGDDVMAGGADSDVMFGELGNDLMQGDGSIKEPPGEGTISRVLNITDTGMPQSDFLLLRFNIPEAASDGDDYMEGNGGSDLMYGGLGQDDMIGGSSALFGLTTEDERPDVGDIIFGGAGIDIARNYEGDATIDGNNNIVTTQTGHARDADFIMGDNANVFRIVQGGASGTNPTDLKDKFLTFLYDNYHAPTPPAVPLKIIVRGMQQLDYTLGGADYTEGTYSGGIADPDGLGTLPADNGGSDFIHGESGDDYIFGMTGSDILFGDGQDDDIVGGYGNDWISGGTGQDGILGDDGLILTSRNSTAGEPLYGIAGLLASDPSTRYSNGTALDETIQTPGDIQIATINITGQLKKSVDIVPFSYDPDWLGLDDEYPDDASTKPFADDMIFGGLGSDWLHGGSGDDAISGAEALEHAHVPVFLNDADPEPDGVLDQGYDSFVLPALLNPGAGLALVVNPGNTLAFNPVDLDGQHLNNRFRAGEFFLYDEYDPLRKILLTPTGDLYKGTGGTPGVDFFEFVLNFDRTEGVIRPAGTVPKATGQQTESYPQVNDDGKDAIFGDLGNDWIVGGTGRDDMFGGWGNDLINSDDNQDTNSRANDQPDTHPYFEDRAYGGAGRDVQIANTGGDRLIDWVGEYNTYLVPFAPFGEATVSRTLMPFLPEYLYALSAGDGADPTRYIDAIGGNPPAPTNNNPIPSRFGEPFGELGLVLQPDFAWQDQTGAPADPQAGNIPGGPRDVLRSADFNGNAPTTSGFFIDSGTWTITQGAYQVEPEFLGGDAVSVLLVDAFVPSYFEVLATVSAGKPTAGYKSNAYVIFDYQSETDFKFAGINVSTNKLEIGHRNESGWIVDKQGAVTGSLRADTNYNIFISFNGSAVIMVVDNTYTMTFTFAPRVDYFGIAHGLHDGMVGLGANNSKAKIDNVIVQKLQPAMTLSRTVDFSSGVTSLFDAPLSGSWSVSAGRYAGTAGTAPAIDTVAFNVHPAAVIDLSAKFTFTGEGGLVYDQYAIDDFKFVTISAGKIILGHRTSRGWFTDAVINNSSVVAGTDYTLGIMLKGTTVSVTLNGSLVASRTYNAVVTDGNFGLLSRTGTTSFDTVTVKSDDPSLLNQSFALTADAASTPSVEPVRAITDGEIAIIANAAIQQWSTTLPADQKSVLSNLQFVLVTDLPGDAVAWNIGDGITLVDMNAAGRGWFIDSTPWNSAEFRNTGGGMIARPNSSADGRIDLLTALVHEIGHTLNLEHSDDGAMQATIGTGERYVINWDTNFTDFRGALGWNSTGTSNKPAFPEFSMSKTKKKSRLESDAEESQGEAIAQIDWYVEV